MLLCSLKVPGYLLVSTWALLLDQAASALGGIRVIFEANYLKLWDKRMHQMVRVLLVCMRVCVWVCVCLCRCQSVNYAWGALWHGAHFSQPAPPLFLRRQVVKTLQLLPWNTKSFRCVVAAVLLLLLLARAARSEQPTEKKKSKRVTEHLLH